jgi:copper transport protein
MTPTSATTSTSTRIALAVMVAVGLIVLAASPAAAHAYLVEAVPADRSQLEAAPGSVTLTFNEPVELTSGGLRVFDADAQRVDTEVAASDDATAISADLPASLPDGGYVVVYRVISADSHPVAGVVTFTVGDGEEVADAVVAELFGGAGRGVTGVLGPLLRGLGYLATLLAAGAALFALLVARQPREQDEAGWVGQRAALAGIVVALLAVPVQGAAVAGASLVGGLSPTVLGETLTSSFGFSTLVRVGGLALLVVLWSGRDGARTPTAVIAVPAVAALGSYLLDGHQRTVDPTWLVAGGDAIHLLAGALWLAGVVLLLLAVRGRGPDDDAIAGAELVRRFSAVALVSVAALAVGGVAMSSALVGSPSALTSTSYGWTLMVKVGVVGLIVLVAAYNRQRLVPAITARLVPQGGSVDTPPVGAAEATEAAVLRGRAAWRQLRSTLAIEVGLLAVVLLITGALVTQQPASVAAGLSGSFQTTVALDESLDLDVVVDPNRAGLNTLHLYVLDATGRPATEADDLRLELTYVPEGIGPIVVEPFFAGPGHWTATIEDLAFPGDWDVRVVVGVDRFTEASTTIRVTVAD